MVNINGNSNDLNEPVIQRTTLISMICFNHGNHDSEKDLSCFGTVYDGTLNNTLGYPLESGKKDDDVETDKSPNFRNDKPNGVPGLCWKASFA